MRYTVTAFRVAGNRGRHEVYSNISMSIHWLVRRRPLIMWGGSFRCGGDSKTPCKFHGKGEGVSTNLTLVHVCGVGRGRGGDKISLSIRTSKKTNFVKQFKAVELCLQDLGFLSLEFLELGFLGKLVCLLQYK